MKSETSPTIGNKKLMQIWYNIDRITQNLCWLHWHPCNLSVNEWGSLPRRPKVTLLFL